LFFVGSGIDVNCIASWGCIIGGCNLSFIQY
jgi:hypothetical protein